VYSGLKKEDNDPVTIAIHSAKTRAVTEIKIL
jgi:hypothetical protein